MKLVLFSVLMLATAVTTAPKHAKLSSENPTVENRREIDLRGLPTVDPFFRGEPTKFTFRFREFNLPKITEEVVRQKKDNRRFHRNKSRHIKRKSGPETILKFRSPQQLQQYLFTEAKNAKHILRSNARVYTPSNQPEISTEYSRNSRGSDSSVFDEVEETTMNRRKRPNRQRYKFLKKYRRRRRPIFLHPYDLPLVYPPPWSPLYVPRVNLMYDHPKKRRKPSRGLTLGDDILKLKQMVDELDAMSEESKEGGTTSSGKSDSEKKEKERNETIVDMKDKIDKVIIPILNKISSDLNASVSSVNPSSRKTETDAVDEKKTTEKDKEIDKKEEPHVKHNFPCRIDGAWVCTTDALHLNISTMPNMTLKVTVVAENSKKSTHITKDWAINGITLATTGGPFLLAAICPEKRKVANFIGQCRSCREEDTIFGFWTFSTAGRDCTEIFTSFETKIDVFKRDKSQQTKGEKT